jgi:hypothetical protein
VDGELRDDRGDVRREAEAAHEMRGLKIVKVRNNLEIEPVAVLLNSTKVASVSALRGLLRS